MIRKQIYISAAEDERLKQIAQANGISEAALIRNAIDQRLQEEDAREAAWNLLQGMLHERPTVGAPQRFQRSDAYSGRVGQHDEPD